MEVKIEGSFESLSQDEWDKYLSVDFFEDMFIKEGSLGESEDIFQNISTPRLHKLIQEHNNKVGSLRITYALCRHYFDRGIPDDPWYISPGKNGESVQYFPEFKEAHWMRKYWFNYFADTFYLKISAVWDSVIEIINEKYQYGFQQDLRFRSNVFKKLKDDNKDLLNLFNAIQSDDLYIEAQKYRTAAAHGTSAGDISNTVTTQRDVITEIPELVDGKLTKKMIKAKMVVAVGVGDYTKTETIMTNIEQYSKFTGLKIQEAINLME